VKELVGIDSIRERPPQGGFVRPLSFVLFWLALSSPALPADLGALAGSVRTGDGQPVPHLALILRGPSGSQTVVTGPGGRYRVAGLSPGAYTIAVPSPGFVLSPEPRVDVGPGESTLDLVLAPAPVREQVVVTATRTEAALSTLGATVAILDHERIHDRAPGTFLDLLRDLPGMATARAGGLGLQSSAFVRGGESRFARILVDGVPVNQPGGAFDFGSLLPLELERVEVLRGAASSLYGTDALAGVVQILTRRASPGSRPEARLSAEGGSFDGRRFQGGTGGTSGRFDWNAGLMRLDTDNQQPNSAFGETAGAGTLGVQLSEGARLRLVARVEKSDVGTPGQTAYGRPDLEEHFERNDVTVGGQLRLVGARFAHDLHVGYARTRQLTLDPGDSGPFVPRSGDHVGFPIPDSVNTAGFQNLTSRLAVSYQAEAQAGQRHLLTGGVELEREAGELGDRSAPLLSPTRTNFGVYVQDRVLLGDRVDLTLGGRVERNGSFGTKVVPRASLAVRLRGGENATTLRASAGTGIKEPGFFESYGVSFYARGNPDLRPERSRTVDGGIEQRLFRDRLRIQATAYYHEYKDQITYTILDFTTFAGSYTNLEKTRAKGLEAEIEARPRPWLHLFGSYTYLDGRILASGRDFDPVYAEGEPLLRRPKHQGSFTAFLGDECFGFGATLVAVGERADSDFAGLGLTRNPGYERLDLRARVRVVGGLEAFVVGENVLDEDYQEVLGYPALGRSLRAGLRFRSGARP